VLLPVFLWTYPVSALWLLPLQTEPEARFLIPIILPSSNPYTPPLQDSSNSFITGCYSIDFLMFRQSFLAIFCIFPHIFIGTRLFLKQFICIHSFFSLILSDQSAGPHDQLFRKLIKTAFHFSAFLLHLDRNIQNLPIQSVQLRKQLGFSSQIIPGL